MYPKVKAFFRINKGGNAVLRPFMGEGLFYWRYLMGNVDLLGIVLILAGCLLVYGAEKIIKLINRKKSDSTILVIKLAGLTIGAAGCLKIFKVF